MESHKSHIPNHQPVKRLHRGGIKKHHETKYVITFWGTMEQIPRIYVKRIHIRVIMEIKIPTY